LTSKILFHQKIQRNNAATLSTTPAFSLVPHSNSFLKGVTIILNLCLERSFFLQCPTGADNDELDTVLLRRFSKLFARVNLLKFISIAASGSCNNPGVVKIKLFLFLVART